MTNPFDRADAKLREEYEETFFAALMEGYTEYQGEQLRQQAMQDAPPSDELCAQMQEKIARELRQQRRRRTTARLLRVRKYVAVLLIVAFAAFTTSFVTVEAFRVRVLNLFAVESGTATIYGLLEEKDGPLVPKYIPEDMYVSVYDDDLDPTTILLQNTDASRYAQICFYSEGTRLSVDNENLSVRKQVDINGTQATYTEKRGIGTLVWITPDHAHIAAVFSNLPEEEILAIARSIPLPS